MKDYTNESPVFSDKIKILETTDTDHADNFNKFAKQLLDNDVALKAVFDEFVEQVKEIAFTGSYDDLADKPEKFPPDSHKHAKADITDFPSIPAAVRVKGDAESSYRTGDVNLTPANIGAAPSSHSHSEYAAASHSHSNYAAASHSHSGYAAVSHSHSDFPKDIWLGDNSSNSAAVFMKANSCFYNVASLYYDVCTEFDKIYNSNFHSTLRGNYTKGQKSFCSVYASGLQLARIGSLFIHTPYGNRVVLLPCSNGGGICLESYTSDGTNCSSFYLMPVNDNLGYIGASDKRWKQVYAVNGTISTSDARTKKDISYMGRESSYDTKLSDNQLMAFIMELKPVVFRRKDGESGRPHHGLISQDVEEALKTAGITDHAGFIKSPKTKSVEKEREIEKTVQKKDGTVETVKEIEKYSTQEEIPGEYLYSLRYEEFIADVIRFCQILYDKSVEQDEKIASLEERMARMEAEAMSDKTGN